jgi:hypothetical protein
VLHNGGSTMIQGIFFFPMRLAPKHIYSSYCTLLLFHIASGYTMTPEAMKTSQFANFSPKDLA